MDYQDNVKDHYMQVWQNSPNICYWDKGPANELPYNFRVLEYEPTQKRKMWTYATCCMSQETDLIKIELHLFSSKKDIKLIELLTAVAHYHRTGKQLNLAHTVNFGKPWQDNSTCQYGLISLPYINGSDLEDMVYNNELTKFYWLIPITLAELNFKKLNGIDALEEKFDERSFNYLDTLRSSVV